MEEGDLSVTSVLWGEDYDEDVGHMFYPSDAYFKWVGNTGAYWNSGGFAFTFTEGWTDGPVWLYIEINGDHKMLDATSFSMDVLNTDGTNAYQVR